MTVNRAGGFFYHLRALHAARARWQPFRRALGVWLERDFHAGSSLVLVGPSAAYCIGDAFLTRFEHVTALEPDPIARWLLSRRARRLGLRSLELVSEDLLVEPLVSGARGLDDFLGGRPDASVLFANVLGQIRFLLPEERFAVWQAAWTKRIAPVLASRNWASFHDRVSGPVPPTLVTPYRTPSRLPDSAVQQLYGLGEGRVELLDHLTEGLFPSERPHAYFHWEIEPGAQHLVEGVCGRRPL